MSERTFRRWRDRSRSEGAEGLFDRRLGKVSAGGRRDEILRMLGLYREHYVDFTAKHFHEQLVTRHHYGSATRLTKLQPHRSGLVKPAPRRSAHRKKRPRRPMKGMLLHQDGSRHDWLAGAQPLDLVVTLDDATSEIYSAFFVAEEGTTSTFRALAEVVAAKGLFCALYTDRGSHYLHSRQPAAKWTGTTRRRWAWALGQLGIELISAYSPEARGRSERMCEPAGSPAEGAQAGRYHRHRRRQPLAGRSLSARAQRPLRRCRRTGRLRLHRRRRAGLAGHPLRPGRSPGRQRQHRHVETALPADPAVAAASPLHRGPRSASHEYPDGRLAVFWGPHRLADYDPQGTIIDARALAARAASAASPAVDLWISLPRSPQPHSRNHHRSGQFTRYENRST